MKAHFRLYTYHLIVWTNFVNPKIGDLLIDMSFFNFWNLEATEFSQLINSNFYRGTMYILTSPWLS